MASMAKPDTRVQVKRIIYSFCERVWAGPRSPWHIRPLTSIGRKLGGGIDTTSLCGRVDKGWDLDVEVTPHHLDHACKACVEVYRGRLAAVRS